MSLVTFRILKDKVDGTYTVFIYDGDRTEEVGELPSSQAAKEYVKGIHPDAKEVRWPKSPPRAE